MAHIAAKPVMTIKAILNTGAVSTATPVKSRLCAYTVSVNVLKVTVQTLTLTVTVKTAAQVTLTTLFLT